MARKKKVEVDESFHESIPSEAKEFMEELGALLNKYHARISTANVNHNMKLSISVDRYAFYLNESYINKYNYNNPVFVHRIY